MDSKNASSLVWLSGEGKQAMWLEVDRACTIKGLGCHTKKFDLYPGSYGEGLWNLRSGVGYHSWFPLFGKWLWWLYWEWMGEGGKARWRRTSRMPAPQFLKNCDFDWNAKPPLLYYYIHGNRHQQRSKELSGELFISSKFRSLSCQVNGK